MGQTGEPAPYHLPVLVREVVEIFRPLERGVIVDATFGGGGHTRALLQAMPGVEIVGVDRDPDARSQAPVSDRFRFVAGDFADLDRVLRDAGLTAEMRDDNGGRAALVGFLFDLGVSSHQLDTAARGFSYHRAGPLDMRMDPDSSPSADEVVNHWPEDRLAADIRRFGEERYARRIAAAIVAARPIAGTAELSRVVANAVPAPARRKRHPARRTFQAIRIVVNAELDALERALDTSIGMLARKGRLAVISYHSLEDRIVKRRFAAGTSACVCPPDFPVCTCGRVTELRSLTRGGVTPTPEEVAGNPRARSARLRAVEKVVS